jgi:hypothetical protein
MGGVIYSNRVRRREREIKMTGACKEGALYINNNNSMYVELWKGNKRKRRIRKMVTYHRGVCGKENSVESCRAGSFVLLVGGKSICKWI